MTTSRASHAVGGARERAADVGDVDDSDPAGAVGDRQLPEPSIDHGSRRIARMLVAAGMAAGRAVRRSWIRVLFTSMPSATARAISASVIMPMGGLQCCAPSTTKAADPACFIRYAASADHA